MAAMIPWQLPAQNIKLSGNAFLPNCSQISLVLGGEILTSPNPGSGRDLEVLFRLSAFPICSCDPFWDSHHKEGLGI